MIDGLIGRSHEVETIDRISSQSMDRCALCLTKEADHVGRHTGCRFILLEQRNTKVGAKRYLRDRRTDRESHVHFIFVAAISCDIRRI